MICTGPVWNVFWLTVARRGAYLSDSFEIESGHNHLSSDKPEVPRLFSMSIWLEFANFYACQCSHHLMLYFKCPVVWLTCTLMVDLIVFRKLIHHWLWIWFVKECMMLLQVLHNKSYLLDNGGEGARCLFFCIEEWPRYRCPYIPYIYIHTCTSMDIYISRLTCKHWGGCSWKTVIGHRV